MSTGGDLGPTEEQMAGWSDGTPVSEPPTADSRDEQLGTGDIEGTMPDGTARDSGVPQNLEEEGAP